MDCEAYEALAVDLLYGDITPERRADAHAHATSCGECGKLSSELDDARRTAASLPSRIGPPPELDHRILLAARAAVDVRKQPIRGGGLHVAAAAVLAALLTGVSFVVGMNVGKPRIGVVEDDPRLATTNPKKNGGESALTGHGGVDTTPPSRPNDREGWRAYQESLLKMANEDLARGDFKRALIPFGGVYSGGGRTQMALEARLGMAKCFQALGQLEEARAAARDAREKNGEWGTEFDNIEDESGKLIKEINNAIQERERKKLEEQKLQQR